MSLCKFATEKKDAMNAFRKIITYFKIWFKFTICLLLRRKRSKRGRGRWRRRSRSNLNGFLAHVGNDQEVLCDRPSVNVNTGVNVQAIFALLEKCRKKVQAALVIRGGYVPGEYCE